MANVLEFEVKHTVEIDIDELADELERSISPILYDYQGLTDYEMGMINFDAVKEAVASKWLGKLS